jgi:Fe-S-cluster containining protein
MLGEKKREENGRFRTFMKSRDHSDRILRRIAQGIEDEMDCTVCANCCRVATATVKERDIEHLARFLRISEARFIAEYTTEDEEEGRILRRTDAEGCVFLSGNECTVYEARPDACRRMWCAETDRSPAACGSSWIARVIVPSSITRSRRSSKRWDFGTGRRNRRNPPAKALIQRKTFWGRQDSGGPP